MISKQVNGSFAPFMRETGPERHYSQSLKHKNNDSSQISLPHNVKTKKINKKNIKKHHHYHHHKDI